MTDRAFARLITDILRPCPICHNEELMVVRDENGSEHEEVCLCVKWEEEKEEVMNGYECEQCKDTGHPRIDTGNELAGFDYRYYCGCELGQRMREEEEKEREENEK